MPDNEIELDARCTCTMDKIDNGWAKPATGYKDPDKNCPICNGSGFLTLRIGPEIEAIWYGECPVCGEQNGGHIQYKGKKAPNAGGSPLGQPSCMNDECLKKGIKCIWKKEAEEINPQNN